MYRPSTTSHVSDYRPTELKRSRILVTISPVGRDSFGLESVKLAFYETRGNTRVRDPGIMCCVWVYMTCWSRTTTRVEIVEVNSSNRSRCYQATTIIKHQYCMALSCRMWCLDSFQCFFSWTLAGLTSTVHWQDRQSSLENVFQKSIGRLFRILSPRTHKRSKKAILVWAETDYLVFQKSQVRARGYRMERSEWSQWNGTWKLNDNVFQPIQTRALNYPRATVRLFGGRDISREAIRLFNVQPCRSPFANRLVYKQSWLQIRNLKSFWKIICIDSISLYSVQSKEKTDDKISLKI